MDPRLRGDGLQGCWYDFSVGCCMCRPLVGGPSVLRPARPVWAARWPLAGCPGGCSRPRAHGGSGGLGRDEKSGASLWPVRRHS